MLSIQRKFCSVAIPIVFFTSCCTWKYNQDLFEFTVQENEHFKYVKSGDTIFYESNLGNVDSFTIISISEEKILGNKCFISNPPVHNKSINIKNLPANKQSGTSMIKDSSKENTCQYLLNISKYPLGEKVSYSVNYKNFLAMGDSVFNDLYKSLTINGVEINNCYKIKNSYPERLNSSNDIETLYWCDRFGLTGYTTKNGETYLIKSN